MFRFPKFFSAPTRAAKNKSQGTVSPHSICSICRENVSAKNSATIDCAHSFHLKCIRQWVDAQNQTCPNCRAPVSFMKCGWRKMSTKRKPKKPSHSFIAKLIGWFAEVHGEPERFVQM